MTHQTATGGPAPTGGFRSFANIFLVEGIVLVILGVLAVLVPVIATLALTIFLGWLFLISGVMGLVTSFWARHVPGFWWGVLSAIVSIIAGLLLVSSPVVGAVSLTYVLVAFFLIEGIVTIMYALQHRAELPGRWAFMLISGIITLLLAVMIVMGLPATAAWAIGLLVGIDMIFGGAALIAMATAARRGA
jgi:uncharacterized membrane protein HdeD (DUF308 family)